VDWEQLLSDQISQDGRLLFGLAYGVLRSADAAEDVCQQAMLQAWAHRSELKDPVHFRA
jgi:DNA-directed RNA polymerase specialized sigma24 family protein